MGIDQPWHWVVIAILVLALFYSKKLPDAARSLGRSLRIFKTEIKGMNEDDKARAESRADDEPPPAAPRALPAAEVVKNDTVTTPPRPRPSPNGTQRASTSDTAQ